PEKGKGTNGADPGANVDALLGTATPPVVPPPSPATTSRLVLAGFSSSLTAGASGTFTVTATDANGNLVMGYHGTVHFSSSDLRAVLPSNYTFTAGDNGVHSFSATLKTAGSTSLTATDTATGSITATQSGILVHPAAASGLTLGGFPNSVTAGTAASFS